MGVREEEEEEESVGCGRLAALVREVNSTMPPPRAHVKHSAMRHNPDLGLLMP